jgi:hypothetical protein
MHRRLTIVIVCLGMLLLLWLSRYGVEALTRGYNQLPDKVIVPKGFRFEQALFRQHKLWLLLVKYDTNELWLYDTETKLRTLIDYER